MHEIGHNVGLMHSSSKINYGDLSCYMGASPALIDGPRMCFNSQKSWQLGWYSGSTLVVDATQVKISGLSLVGIADYEQKHWWQLTIINIINTDDGFDYFISFNRQSGINSETQNSGDQVLVIKYITGSFYSDSILAARLNTGQMYSIFKFDGYSSLEIWPNIYNETSPPYANVNVFKNFAQCTSDQDCHDSNSCTADTCVLRGYDNSGFCVYSDMNCSSCGSMVTVESMTNDYPEHFNWNIRNVQTGQIIESSDFYELPNVKDSVSRCIEYGKYDFIVSYPENTNLTIGINFTLHVGKELIYYSTMFEMEQEEIQFTICSSDEDCRDYNGCTNDYCDMESKLCNNSLTECVNCSYVLVDIFPDNVSFLTLIRRRL